MIRRLHFEGHINLPEGDDRPDDYVREVFYFLIEKTFGETVEFKDVWVESFDPRPIYGPPTISTQALNKVFKDNYVPFMENVINSPTALSKLFNKEEMKE